MQRPTKITKTPIQATVTIHVGFCHVRSLLVSTYKLSRFEQRTIEVSFFLFAAWVTKNWQRAEGGTRSQVSQCFCWQERSVRSEGMFFLYPNPASASQRKNPWNGPHPFSTTANSWHWHQQRNVYDLCCTVHHSCWIFCRVLFAAWIDGKIPLRDTLAIASPTRQKSCHGSQNNIHGPCHGPMSLGEKYSYGAGQVLKNPMARKPFQGAWSNWGSSSISKRVGDELYRHINQIHFSLAA